MTTVAIVVGYALIALGVAILAARWFGDVDKPEPWGDGLAGIGAGIFWPVTVTLVALLYLGRAISWLGGAR